MIPTGTSRPFGRPSPRLSEMDLVKLINRTVQMAVDGKRELGFAAVNVGCDGKIRTTMFDGSSCQVSGEVCIAERQDGISACIQAPTQGNGLTMQSLVFAAPVCAPITGWWLLDAEGFLYRVPQELIDAAPYWPMSEPIPTTLVLVRAGTWATLMCAAPLVIPLNSDGGAEWVQYGESDWEQRLAVAIGGVEGWVGSDGGAGCAPAILLRDVKEPNAGFRVVTVTLPAADVAIVTGDVRVAYGYPHGGMLSGLGYPSSSAPPYPRAFIDPPGTWQSNCAGRTPGDMALVYGARLAVEYASDHINLDGDAITDPGDYVSPVAVDLRDVRAGLVALPGGEIAHVTAGRRYRVRPAPAVALTLVDSHQTPGGWDDDPNVLVQETEYNVAAWEGDATEFSVAGSGGEDFPSRGVAIVLWETNSSSDTYSTAPVAYFGTLGPTAGGLTSIAFIEGTIVGGSGTYTHRHLTVIGPLMEAKYGWTAVVREDPDDTGSPVHETALSPLAGASYAGTAALYSRAITIPAGPAGTVERRVYRHAWDGGSTAVGDARPWDWAEAGSGPSGGNSYDRMCRLIATVVASEAEPGTSEITVWDTETSLAAAGTRPPSPLVYAGPLAVDSPHSVHVLQPLDL